MLTLLLVALLSPAHAADDCDIKALTKALDETSPISLPGAYSSIVACDEDVAKKVTEKVFSKLLAGPDEHAAALQAIRLEQGHHVVTWIAALEPDQRSRALNYLGNQCGEQESVQAFFIESYSALGADFWKNRWHRGLADCRAESVQKLLLDALNDKEFAKDRTRMFNVLEVYARNVRGAAIPKLTELAQSTTDEEELTYLVNAYADATGIGSVAGVDKSVAGAAAAAIESLGPKLPARAIEQARTTLNALDAAQIADSFAAYRWPERKVDGDYRYAVVVTEKIICKNTKTRSFLHVASFTEPGARWPNQLSEGLDDRLKHEWVLDSAERCKGSLDLMIDLPTEPFESDEARDAWTLERVEAFEKNMEQYDKAGVNRRDPFAF